ncbi:hypothetical protein I6H58_02370 [Rothia kristinae]|uniref:DUF559 domain-containing protein n=1 Tax=Rothia kristinae TaxID=37923 RepID=A0A7T4MUG9_9MICC|nr:hypothetical protein [Rothia kristinae]QQC59843.1 hypothetical protein I6H58_02370 [Rothia kristinae]
MTPSDILLARDLLGLGMSRRAFYEALRTGRLIRLRPGAGIDADLWQRLSPRERRITDHLTFALTRPAALSRPPVFSHDSALLLHGLSLVALPSRLHVAGSPRPHHHAADVTTHEDPHAQARVHLDRYGVDTVAPPVALVQSLLILPFADGLVLADQALDRGLSREHGCELLARGGSRHRARAQAVLDAADAASESVLESQARAELIRHGVPRPVLQLPVRTERGWRRLDMAWEDELVALEVDGRTKYFDYEPTDVAISQERKREVELMERGWLILRTDAARVLHQPGATARLVARSLAQRRGLRRRD